MLTLGWASGHPTALGSRKMEELAALLAKLTGFPFSVAPFIRYDDLSQAVFNGEVDVAWLPPITFLALVTRSAIAPLASVRSVPYQSAIIVPKHSPLSKPASLIGKRAAWVDRHSASGFVVPRIKLARFGIDPRMAFGEVFLHSHEAVVEAVAAERVDFGAVWAQPGSRGAVTGPWSRTTHEVRVLATFGNIPPDVIAARVDLPEDLRRAVVVALTQIRDDQQARYLVSHVMGTKSFYRPKLELYRSLQNAVIEAHDAGLLTDDAPTAPQMAIPKDIEFPTMASREAFTPVRGPARTIPEVVMEMRKLDTPDASGPFPELEEIEIDVSFD